MVRAVPPRREAARGGWGGRGRWARCATAAPTDQAVFLVCRRNSQSVHRSAAKPEMQPAPTDRASRNFCGVRFFTGEAVEPSASPRFGKHQNGTTAVCARGPSPPRASTARPSRRRATAGGGALPLLFPDGPHSRPAPVTVRVGRGAESPESRVAQKRRVAPSRESL